MTYTNDIEAVEALVRKHETLRKEVEKVIIGQQQVVEDVLISLFGRGHCLLIGVPGLAKTLLINTTAKALGLKYSRIQFTPDLMPSDIVGTEILDENRKFRFIQGPVFANIILADEINRTPPKTQSALLEAMQEKNVTVAGNTYQLAEPFFVLATQNPIEQEGTYPLPEAQLDRFMFNILLSYPDFKDEVSIVSETTSDKEISIDVILSADEIIYFQNLIRRIPVVDNVIQYAVKLVSKTRPGSSLAHPIADKYISWGAGPRASQYLIIGAKCHAALYGKFSPDIEDVKKVAALVLRHRIVRNYKAEADGISVDAMIEELLKN
ncbi:MAG: ATPase family associated with various cellular activities (AAA) [Bacteroidetes bacterium ADurb.Bin408]|nr:MAG: ATPase family associated with various cellular activities (AAA) [Bacteroidetes bacterium ADurb.Bin408]